MADLFDYLQWRGDLSFAQMPPTAVDALIFSALAYIRFGGSVESQPDTPVGLREAAEDFFALEDRDDRIRTKNDLTLLLMAAKSRRFGAAQLYQYRDILEPENETQFAAVTFLLDDGSAFLAFRGTDDSLTGWKEDFNMSFLESVPAQRMAVDYVESFVRSRLMPIRLAGHSKGGNLRLCRQCRHCCPVFIRMSWFIQRHLPYGFLRTDEKKAYGPSLNLSAGIRV